MAEVPVILEKQDRVARITLNRPARMNAITRELIVELRVAIEDAAGDDNVRVISLTGAGRGFCAGQDLSERDPRKLDGPLDLEALQQELYHPVVRALHQTDKPIVACVNGVAAGAGAAIALASDIAVAAENAQFVFSFARVGLSVDAGLGRILVQTLGPAKARALLMLGLNLSAREAADAGLIWRAVPEEELHGAHEALLGQLAVAPRISMSGIKTAVAAAHLPLRDYLAIEAEAQGNAGRHPDYAEGVLAFLEKRAAKFN